MSAAERKVSAPVRPSIRGTAPRVADLASTPESPRTPLGRSTSSYLGSPGGSFRTEEECVILELGARYVRGGLLGESAPRCTLSFGPEEQRRVGDYRPWDPEYARGRRKQRSFQEWGSDHELYRLDLSQVDLGLVEDKFERAIREAYTKYFLLGTKPPRVLLALPSRMPHALMSTILDVLFSSFQTPSITIMSSPILAAVAAGVRSALVVDIGWAETVVTAVCEYREVSEQRSVRAGKLLSVEMAKLLNAELDDDAEPRAPHANISFDEANEVLTRVAWCKPNPRSNRRTLYFPAREAPVLEEWEDAVESPPPTIDIPFPKHNPPTELRIPFASLGKPAEAALFAPEMAVHEFDDEELPLHHLLYRALVSLPIDVRRLCMSRIIITGGVSAMPGLKTRLLKELEALISIKGWDVVKNYGKASAKHEEQLRDRREEAELRRQEGEDNFPESLDPGGTSNVPAGLQSPEINSIDRNLEHFSQRNGPPPACYTGGAVRGIGTLGVWTGASIMAQQRVKGIVEIERERYLQHGLQGASREKEVSVIAQRQSMIAPGLAKGAGERASWTLGVWA